MEITEALAMQVLEVVNLGLARGSGGTEPGEMAIEEATLYALDLSRRDPLPFGAAVTDYLSVLNYSDAWVARDDWTLNKTRAEGLRRAAIAQLGSDTIDQGAFAKYVVAQIIRRVLPIALRAPASSSIAENEEFPPIKMLEVVAGWCETRQELNGGWAAYQAFCISNNVTYQVLQRADSYLYEYAARAAMNAWSAASFVGHGNPPGDNEARFAAVTASFAASAANAVGADGNEVLRLAAEIAVEALARLESPGARWLSLCEGESKTPNEGES